MHIPIIRHGFILILLALISGLFVPTMEIPRLGLSAHTVGILSGVLLIAVGSIWQLIVLSDSQRSIMHWSWLYASYVNWLGCLAGAIFGAGKSTPLASAGVVGTPTAELLVAVLLTSAGVLSFVAVGLSLWGLRRVGISDA
ncbi:MAG: hydrogenase [Gammaproteobacteria bacterium]|nr:hydrogenase [Gammaproteobacteria bacterium]MDH3769138.1 hydrogenase [Gammaproteobacteria bacterium]